VGTIVPGAGRASGRHRRPDVPSKPPRPRLVTASGAAARFVVRAGLLTAGMVAVLVVLVHALGWSALIVRSGSMEPAVPVGSLVIARPVSGPEVRVADPIIVQRSGSSGPVAVLHRVVAVQERNGQRFAQLKGDANSTPDPELAALRQPVGRPVLVVPGAGYAISAVRGLVPTSRLLLPAVGILGLCLIWGTGSSRRRAPARHAAALVEDPVVQFVPPNGLVPREIP
jgi:signal peptidase I